MSKVTVCNINLSLLPVKLHYLIFYGAMAGVQKFMPLLAKGHGINATAVGLVYTALPFCIFFSKPFFGYLTDYFHNMKVMVFTLLSVTTLAYLAVLLIPKPQDLPWTQVHVECMTDNRWLSVVPQDCDKVCFQDAVKQATNCELSYLLCAGNSSVTLLGKTTIDDTINGSTSLFSSHYGTNSSIVLRFVPEANSTCDCVAQNSSLFRCTRPDVNACFMVKNQSVFKTYRFWAFALLALISGIGAAVLFTLSDALCYEVLEDNPEHFGRQRMWSAFGWGSFSLLAGLMNDLATGDSDVANYYPGFCIMLVLVVMNLILLRKIKLSKPNLSTNILKDIGKVFSSCNTVVFAIYVYILGVLTGLIVNYQFWYLQDLGASQTLLGLITFVPCLVAEGPLLYFSGWFLQKLGYFYCLIAIFAEYSFRLCMYYFLKNPWFALPIELINSLVFAVFISAMTGYAAKYAPPGTEATMMGIFGGLLDGIGIATGSFLGGVGFDFLGGRRTFLAGAIICLVSTVTLVFTYAIMKRRSPKGEERKKSQEYTTMELNRDGTKP